MKIYTIYTNGYSEMMNLFSASVVRFQDSFELIKLYCELPEGPLFGAEYERVILFKITKVVQSIRDNMGDIIIWSDCDILFLKNPIDTILEYIKDYDVAGMNHGNASHFTNGGFYAIRCSPKTLSFWRKVWNQSIINTKNKKKSNGDFLEMTIMHRLFKNNLFDVKLNILPDSFWAYNRIYRSENMPQESDISVLHFIPTPSRGKSIVDQIKDKVDMMKEYAKRNEILSRAN